jgi:hypothetical protein
MYKWFEDLKQLTAAVGPSFSSMAWPLVHMRKCAPTGMPSWGKEDPVEKILLVIFFVQLNKRGTRPHNACLPFSQLRDARLTYEAKERGA